MAYPPRNLCSGITYAYYTETYPASPGWIAGRFGGNVRHWPFLVVTVRKPWPEISIGFSQQLHISGQGAEFSYNPPGASRI